MEDALLTTQGTVDEILRVHERLKIMDRNEVEKYFDALKAVIEKKGWKAFKGLSEENVKVLLSIFLRATQWKEWKLFEEFCEEILKDYKELYLIGKSWVEKRRHLLRILKALKKKAKKVVIFGSYADGTFTAFSDIDVAVEGWEWAPLLSAKGVEVFNTEELPKNIKKEVERGVVVMENGEMHREVPLPL